MSWTDAELARMESSVRREANRIREATGQHEEAAQRIERDAELYRYARLGLAAEQVGNDTLAMLDSAELSDKEEKWWNAFLNHPAWSKP